MKYCPTPAVESSKIRNGLETAGFQFHTRQPSLSYTCSIGFKSSNKTSDVLLIFVFLDDASKVRSRNVFSEHHVLAI